MRKPFAIALVPLFVLSLLAGCAIEPSPPIPDSPEAQAVGEPEPEVPSPPAEPRNKGVGGEAHHPAQEPTIRIHRGP